MTLLIDGDPLKDSKGREIGTMTADSFLENSGREIYQYQYATLTLYFANEAGDHLVKETWRVPYSTNIPLERVVVEQLMKGPKEDGHYAVLPDTMNVLSVTTSDRIAYVNFDKSFKDSALSSVAEQIPIYAVVDSITANCKVDKVQFSINGESDVTFRETMKLNQSTRKTCLIWRKKIHEKTAHVLACLGFMLVLVLLRIAGVPLGTPFSDPKYENKAQQGRKVWIAGTIETYEKKSSNNGYVLRGEGSKGKIYLLAKRGDLPV